MRVYESPAGASRGGRGVPDRLVSVRLRPGVAGGAESGEYLPADRIVPVAERAPAGDRVHGERTTAHTLYSGPKKTSEYSRRGTPGSPGTDRSRWPSTPTRHPSAAGCPAARRLPVASGRGRAQVALAEVGVGGGGVGVAQG